MMNYLIKLYGLHCEACKKITEKRIGKIDGVTTATTDLAEQTVAIHANRQITLEEITVALKETEYKVISISEIL